VQYKLKWFGYPSTENSWVPYRLCDCDELIHDFEISGLVQIFGAAKVANAIQYAVRDRDNVDFKLVPRIEMLEKWSQQFFQFLEKRIEFAVPCRHVHFVDNIVVNVENIVGKPSQILGK